MSLLEPSTTKSQTKPPNASRGSNKRGGSRGGGGGGESQNTRGGRRIKQDIVIEKPQKEPEPKKDPQAIVALAAEPAMEPREEEEEETDVCWICAEPVKYYAVSECNHRTCHVCALRLRALYKKPDCTFCKEPQHSMVFTVSPDAVFSSFVPDAIPYKDAKLSISFETQEMMEDTLILLRFNCPDSDCAYIGNGWGDLKLHVRATHGKLMCDLCIRMKKVFTHEHALYAPNALPIHLPSMPHRSYGKSIPKDQIEGGVHPICEFCRECFFSDDELYAHLRERHEECFICKRNEVRDQYFQNYQSLENHFNRAHHPCTNTQCLARKFVVFNTALDLQAHVVEEHGNGMSSRDKRDARRIQADFEFEEVGVGNRHGRRDRVPRDREREREHPPHTHRQQAQPEQATPVASAASTFARPTPGRRREDFGGSLTVEHAPTTVTPEPGRSMSPQLDADPAVAERHALFLSRLQSLATNPVTAVPAVKAAIRGYRSSETSAKDFISTIWNILDENLEHTASIVNAFVDLLDQEDKKQDLLSSWRGFALGQRREFPDLTPIAVASGSAPYAAITSGRVLNAKHATATRSSQRSSRHVWDRVAQAASSSLPANLNRPAKQTESFPILSSGAGPPAAGATRQGQRNTPWSASASGFRPASTSQQPTPAQASSHITVVPDPRSSKPSSGRSTPQPPPPKLSNALFPELPTSNAASTRVKVPMSGNNSLKNILGGSTVVPSAWTGGTPGPGGATPTTAHASSESRNAGDAASGTGKGKKGKGKQKQTLFTLGTFPA